MSVLWKGLSAAGQADRHSSKVMIPSWLASTEAKKASNVEVGTGRPAARKAEPTSALSSLPSLLRSIRPKRAVSLASDCLTKLAKSSGRALAACSGLPLRLCSSGSAPRSRAAGREGEKGCGRRTAVLNATIAVRVDGGQNGGNGGVGVLERCAWVGTSACASDAGAEGGRCHTALELLEPAF